MNITQERIREICKSFVSGMNAEQIAAVEGLSDAAVELLLADHAKECCEIQAYLEQMGWTLEEKPAPVLLVRASPALAHGIDVSKHQGTINWDAVAADPSVQFAILRAGYGRYESQVDAQWARNYAECKRLGIPVGAYWYSYATTQADAATEGRLFAKVLAGKQFEYPVYFDHEDGSIPAAQRTACALAFFDAMGAAWYKGYYSYTAWMPSVDLGSIRQHCDTVWLADYRANPDQTIQRDMHQYTSSGTVAGIGGRVDCNRAYVDFPALIRAAGKNGFEKEENTMYSDTLKIGPVSGGDRKTMAALAESLNLPHFDAGDYIVIGPASKGDRKQVAAKAQALGLGVEDYLPPEEPEEPETPENPDVPDMEFDEVMFMLAKLDGKLDRVLEKLDLVQQALEDPAAQQVLDKLEKAGAALAQ
ncbi:glycoside hydrolase family 25 protein [Gemmiger sp. An50]|uniref:glycoside hydrolase family 25 protein n=1 Tax=Gemmiger sp. An50 TaxID=1965639 RepID=UPI000B374D37|nr:glycoside hydrolase family 25 protein [Gemmiger sp. An50]OUN86618.1 hypothetical protein B5G03_07065 [Gemmiger sp. An50]